MKNWTSNKLTTHLPLILEKENNLSTLWPMIVYFPHVYKLLYV
jgi:hypothetical protein